MIDEDGKGHRLTSDDLDDIRKMQMPVIRAHSDGIDWIDALFLAIIAIGSTLLMHRALELIREITQGLDIVLFFATTAVVTCVIKIVSKYREF